MNTKTFLARLFALIVGIAACGDNQGSGSPGATTTTAADASGDGLAPPVKADSALPDLPIPTADLGRGASVEQGETGGSTVDSAIEPLDTAGPPEAGADLSTAGLDALACSWPADFTPASDGAALGCTAHAIDTPCAIPTGATFGPQGVVIGPDGSPSADQSCRFACVGSEYALSCGGEITVPDSGCQTRTMPAPDESLGCRILPIPTPAMTAYYCCPCGKTQPALADAGIMVSTICN